MREILLEHGVSREEIDFHRPDMKSPMYVLTNREKINGANAIVCPDVLEKAYKELGEPYYVLPSSTHELILVKESYGMKPEELRQMVQEVNCTAVQARDLLSNKVFHYDGRKLSAVQEKEQVLEAARQHKLIH